VLDGHKGLERSISIRLMVLSGKRLCESSKLSTNQVLDAHLVDNGDTSTVLESDWYPCTIAVAEYNGYGDGKAYLLGITPSASSCHNEIRRIGTYSAPLPKAASTYCRGPLERVAPYRKGDRG
jgi:hypothetical protein